jgi:adenylate cyclase
VAALATVLVVDPDSEIRASMRLLLEQPGYQVLEAAGGDEALAIVREHRDSLVVVFDLGIPRLDEDRTLTTADRALLERHVYIAMTTTAELLATDTRKALQDRDIPLLEKPFNTDALLRAVEVAELRLMTRIASIAPDRALAESEPLGW